MGMQYLDPKAIEKYKADWDYQKHSCAHHCIVGLPKVHLTGCSKHDSRSVDSVSEPSH